MKTLAERRWRLGLSDEARCYAHHLLGQILDRVTAGEGQPWNECDVDEVSFDIPKAIKVSGQSFAANIKLCNGKMRIMSPPRPSYKVNSFYALGPTDHIKGALHEIVGFTLATWRGMINRPSEFHDVTATSAVSSRLSPILAAVVESKEPNWIRAYLKSEGVGLHTISVERLGDDIMDWPYFSSIPGFDDQGTLSSKLVKMIDEIIGDDVFVHGSLFPRQAPRQIQLPWISIGPPAGVKVKKSGNCDVMDSLRILRSLSLDHAGDPLVDRNTQVMV